MQALVRNLRERTDQAAAPEGKPR